MLDELREKAGPGVTIGSHTWGHEYLPALDSNEVDRNLRQTTTWLKESGLPLSDWLALPYGEGSPEIGQRAIALHHAGVLRISGGLVSRGAPASWVPRINVPAGIERKSLELRTSGLLRR
jgi:peptidoglycan/xylan/chitin deacetylase (PgdA/CDA1 family)